MSSTTPSAPSNPSPTPPNYSAFQTELYTSSILHGKKPLITTDPNKLEEQARAALPLRSYNYVAGGAGERATMDANRQAFRRWALVPRMLRDTSAKKVGVELFGVKYGEFVGGVNFSFMIRAPVLPPPSSFLKKPSTNLSRASTSGFSVLVVTLDTWSLAWRPADLDEGYIPFFEGVGNAVGFSDPVFRAGFIAATDGGMPEDNVGLASAGWVREVCPGRSRTWEDLKMLRGWWGGKIVLKGIQHVEDARLAVEAGMDGIVVSNHGGRQVDGAIGSLEVLPEIAAAVGDKITVLFDSGIRTGVDVIKALSLGAEAVLVGRPAVYGFAIGGAEGAKQVLRGLLADFEMSLGLAGINGVEGCKPEILRRVEGGGSLRSSN
ncbi:hypothetical protein V501_05035 [Pseudogymnoascus sp. VKM F-4519 (FW-2642)]|nr:hypothetical protein V501_05035 [Pseudogymnoascus sp. VKM F-4519 (FW-2642)]